MTNITLSSFERVGVLDYPKIFAFIEYIFEGAPKNAQIYCPCSRSTGLTEILFEAQRYLLNRVPTTVGGKYCKMSMDIKTQKEIGEREPQVVMVFTREIREG